MLQIKHTADAVAVVSGYGHTVALRRREARIGVGVGAATYTMSHGRFRFRERVKEKRLLTLSEIHAGENGASLLFTADTADASLAVRLSVCGDRLDVSFGPSRFNRLYLRIPALPTEHVYGGGEVFSEFDLRGQKHRVWVAEHANPAAIKKKIARERLFGKSPARKEPFASYETYYAQPTFMSSRKYYFHADATSYCAFDFRRDAYHEIELRQLADLHIGFADSFYGLAENLSALLGRQPELPDWVYDGAILGVQGGTDVVEQKLAAVKPYDTKVAGVWCQDWEGRRVTSFGKQLMWNWKWDETLYPGLDAEIRKLNAQGVRFLGYINPFLAVEKEMYQYASAHGYCVKDKKGADYLVEITTFPAAMVDLTNPDAYTWLKGIIRTNLIDFGLAGWMADFGEYLPTDCVLYSGEDPELAHCAWPARWARLNREAVEEAGKLGEVFFFTRAGHTDTVRYSTMMWNGDQHTDWSFDCGLPSVIPAALSLAVCGFGLSHSDLGGYMTFPPMQRSPELLIRWAEMSAFSPLMRSHEGNRPDANAQFDATPATLEIHAKMSRVHALLKPYIKDMAQCNAARGVPVMRPLFYAYDEARAYTESTEYLFGDDLLVAPVLEEGAYKRTVYLPRDAWIHLWDGGEYGGGTVEIYAPFGAPPVFYRKNSPYRTLFETIKEA